MYITSTSFEENTFLHEHSNQSSSEPDYYEGGGVYISLAGTFMNSSHHLPMNFRFENCTFKNNTAHTSHYLYLFTGALGEVHKGYGRGGGVCVKLESGINNVNVLFLGCEFTANRAFLGGGLAVKISGKKDRATKNITVEIIDSTFEENGYDDKQGSGYGLSLIHI